jgi:methylated-DNA-protein-cysteine methyltransferase-like protein
VEDVEAGRLYDHIYALVRMIPPGRVATYGQIAEIVGRCTPRMVGYAMAAVPYGSDVPWHRVLNSRGSVSVRADGNACAVQRGMLEAEGVRFDGRGRVDLHAVGWRGPGVRSVRRGVRRA